MADSTKDTSEVPTTVQEPGETKVDPPAPVPLPAPVPVPVPPKAKSGTLPPLTKPVTKPPPLGKPPTRPPPLGKPPTMPPPTVPAVIPPIAPAPAPVAPEPSRRLTRSIPPPIPTGKRGAPAVLASGDPEVPSALDRAIAARGIADARARAKRLDELLVAVPSDAGNAACLHFQRGELHEAAGDEVRAIGAYRRALELHPSLKPARWALRRAFYKRSQWGDLARLIDGEIDADTDAHERVELLLERARLTGERRDGASRTALDIAAQLGPQHRGVLLELERTAARRNEPARVAEVLAQLADAFEDPEHRIAYLLEAARAAAGRDPARAQAALAAAARVATGLPIATAWAVAVRVARERVRIAEAHDPKALADAIATLADAMTAKPGDEPPFRAIARRSDIVALHRWQAQERRASEPARAWTCIEQALALAPNEPVLLVDLIELACELDRPDELARLVPAWHVTESEAGRTSMISWWCAEGLGGKRRALREALSATAPGFLLLSAAAECDALADVAHVRGLLELANAYLAAGRAARLGTWTGPNGEPRPDPGAAAALYVQASELLAYYVGTPTCIDQAQGALAEALDLMPDHPAVREAAIELDDITGDGSRALERLAAQARAGDGREREILERAIGIAYGHDRHEHVVELERQLGGLATDDQTPLWRLEALLAQLGKTTERAAVLAELAQKEGDPTRRATALLGAARLAERGGDGGAACTLYRQLLTIVPDDVFARDALIDLARASERWEELVGERLAQARATGDGALVRRALREAAWVLEVKLNDSARAAQVFAEWLVRLPGDRTALEGAARCAGRIGDHGAEIAARAAIAAVDRSPEAAWLHAYALERGRRGDAAREIAQELAAGEESGTATSAALALACLAGGGSAAVRAEAAERLAARTTDPALAATLGEAAGWIRLVALEDTEGALTAFATALERLPGRTGGRLGAVLAAGCRSDRVRRGEAQAELAESLDAPELASALYLRAAVNAQAAGNVALAYERVEAARKIAPDDASALLVLSELDPPERASTGDPFAEVEELLARADILGKRAELADEGRARAAWELDRAEALELAGQLREASELIASVLRAAPTDRRAVAMVRRIAKRAEDHDVIARASHALACMTRDPERRLLLLREAVAAYERATEKDAVQLRAALQRIVALDPAGPEGERLTTLLRELGDVHGTVRLLTARLQHVGDDARTMGLLFERAVALRRAGDTPSAIADLDAVLERDRDHVAALRMRAELARDSGDKPRAERYWRAYVELENTASARIDVSQMMAEGGGASAPADSGTGIRAEESTNTTGTWDEYTDPEAPAPPPQIASAALGLRRTSRDLRIPQDPFGGETPPADLTALQESERRIARASTPPAFKAMTQFSGDTNTAVTPMPVIPAEAVRPLRVPALDLTPFMSGADGDVVLGPVEIRFAERSGLEDSSVAVSFEQLQPERLEATEDMLADHERELTHQGDDPELRIAAARLCERLGHADRARRHYEAALGADPHATSALASLRRMARAAGDLGEVTRLVEVEIPVAGERERAALQRHRIDLLIASGEQDLARVAVGEVLDRAPHDLPALLAHLQLALSDHRTDEVAATLGRLAEGLEGELAGALQYARGVLAVHLGDAATAEAAYAAADAADPDAIGARLGALCDAAARGGTAGASRGMLELAHQVEKEDPVLAAALAVRAATWAGMANAEITAGGVDRGADNRETAAIAAQLAARAAPRDPLIARFAAETALATGETAVASQVFSRWTRCGSSAAERAYAAARAAELDPERLARLWQRVLELDPDDDYAAARLHAAHVASGDARAAADLDFELARATGRVAPVLRAALQLARDGKLAEAADALLEEHEGSPCAPIADALVDALAEAGRWNQRATLLVELAATPGADLAYDVLRLRAALARDAIARAIGKDSPREEREQAIVAALEAWDAVLDDDARTPYAHAAALALAARLDDVAIAIDTLARARQIERSPWSGASLALRHARALVRSDARVAEELVVDTAHGLDDPRCTLAALLAAAHRRDLDAAASALEDRATLLDRVRGAGTSEPTMLRVRAAHLALFAEEPGHAVALLAGPPGALPWLADLIEVAQRRAGTADASAPPRRAGFARLVHDADRSAARGDTKRAVVLYQQALDERSADPLATLPLLRLGTRLRDATLVSALALEQLRLAGVLGDDSAKADAYELLARLDRDVRGDAASAKLALENALGCDPHRIDLVLQLERELAVGGRLDELVQLRAQRLRQLEDAKRPRDLSALLLDTASLAIRIRRPDDELAALCRRALACDPHAHLALYHLDEILRRRGASDELAALQDTLVEYFDDRHAKMVALMRAGELLAGLGRTDDAVQRFARACELAPAYAPALDAWYEIALVGERWIDVAEAAIRKAQVAGEPVAAATLCHLAGVVLMDKVRATQPAVEALARAVDTGPRQLDALVRLRILLEGAGDREHLIGLVRARLGAEQDPGAQVELHRILAELYREGGEREDAMRHFRAMLALDPADIRAHAGLVDLATDQTRWSEAADAVKARIAVERDGTVLRNLNYRLGELTAAHDPAAALQAYQQALAHRPDDIPALIRVADLAIAAGDWQPALDACDKLVTLDQDPERLAAHLRRASLIFARGFSNRSRAERMLLLALESDPTSIEGLRLLGQLYQDAGDKAALDAHTRRLAGELRARLAKQPADGAACRMLAHVLAERGDDAAAAHAAAELAALLGVGSDVVERLRGEPAVAHPEALGAELFAGAVEIPLRRLLQLLAEPIVRHVGADPGVHGVGRKDRLRPHDPIAAHVRDVAAGLGIKEVEVYVCGHAPHVMVAEPTTPPSVVLGAAIASGDAATIRFAAGAALGLVHAGLALPARLSRDELRLLAWTAIRAVQPHARVVGVDEAAVEAQAQKLRRVIAPNLVDDAAAQAAAVQAFDPARLAQELEIGRLRAGFAASGHLASGLALVVAAVGKDLPDVLAGPLGKGIVSFALRL